ncbi:MAG TPA: acyltransferase family protein [Nocardioides sp.]|uniref:acyltransferase family protein n=1 Tax=Nocardioides sp. TaxID=35761 RepID=UPI002E35BD9E|nr:acyltransferase family protein [Nocardioides sp.]HEX5088575.1 acyltransferase family protein [Nocardioides sp.]
MAVPTTTAPSVRDPWFDNAKMALVLLVVVGHSWTLLPHNGVDDHLYDFLYAWHVPAFVFVTGYLSRSFTYEPRRLWQLVRTVVVPYVLFECALALFRIYVGGERLEDLFRDPHWPMWYLSALFFWRLLTPVFKRMPWPLAVAVALATSLVAGLYAGDTLDLARVLGLLPFFVLGLVSTQERLERLRAPWVRNAALVVFLAIAVVTTWTDRFAQTEWFYYRSQYGELDVSDGRALLTRGVLLVIGTLGAWSFMALVPRAGGWFTRMGAATLVVYLFHGFAIKGVEYAGYPGWADEHAAVALVLTTAGAAGLALLLAWPPVARVLVHAVDPFGTAEQHVRRAVRLADAPAQAEEIAVVVEEAAEERVEERVEDEAAGPPLVAR